MSFVTNKSLSSLRLYHFQSNLDVFVNGVKYESLTGAPHVRSSAYQLTIGPNAGMAISYGIMLLMFCSTLKVSKGAKIRNRYNQIPHLTQDIIGKATNSQ